MGLRPGPLPTSPARPGGARWKQLLFCLVLVAGLVLTAEGMLQVLTRSSRSIDAMLAIDPPPFTVEDRALVWRGNPDHPEHDRLGFRNRDVPSQASLVALGDSQTYGARVSAEQAWPRQLEQLTASRTYNMGFPGWGPPQSMLALEESLALKPELVVQALYAGNDLVDSFTFVYDRKRLPQLKSSDERVLRAIQARERADPWEDNPLADQGPDEDRERRRAPRPPDSASELIEQNSRLYGLFNAINRAYSYYQRHPIRPEEDDEYDPLRDDDYLRFDNGRIKTVLTYSYRRPAVNIEDPRIAEGLRITLEVLTQMQRQCLASGVRFAVLLIPTKELVLKPSVDEYLPQVPRSYTRMVQDEEAVRAALREALGARQIPFVDSSAALRELAEEGTLPYSASKDGHLSPAGQRAVAEVVQSTLLAPGT